MNTKYIYYSDSAGMVGRSTAARVPATAGPRHRVHRPPPRQHALHGYCTHHPRSV